MPMPAYPLAVTLKFQICSVAGPFCNVLYLNVVFYRLRFKSCLSFNFYRIATRNNSEMKVRQDVFKADKIIVRQTSPFISKIHVICLRLRPFIIQYSSNISKKLFTFVKCANFAKEKMPIQTRSSGKKLSASALLNTEATEKSEMKHTSSPSRPRGRPASSRKKVGNSAKGSGKVQKIPKTSNGKSASNALKKESSYEFTGFEALTQEAAATARRPLRTRAKRSIASITASSPVAISGSPKRRRTSSSSNDDNQSNHAAFVSHTSTAPTSTTKNSEPSFHCIPTSVAKPQTATDPEQPLSDSSHALPKCRSHPRGKPNLGTSHASPTPSLHKRERLSVSGVHPKSSQCAIEQDQLKAIGGPLNCDSERQDIPRLSSAKADNGGYESVSGSHFLEATSNRVVSSSHTDTLIDTGGIEINVNCNKTGLSSSNSAPNNLPEPTKNRLICSGNVREDPAEMMSQAPSSGTRTASAVTSKILFVSSNTVPQADVSIGPSEEQRSATKNAEVTVAVASVMSEGRLNSNDSSGQSLWKETATPTSVQQTATPSVPQPINMNTNPSKQTVNEGHLSRNGSTFTGNESEAKQAFDVEFEFQERFDTKPDSFANIGTSVSVCIEQTPDHQTGANLHPEGATTLAAYDSTMNTPSRKEFKNAILTQDQGDTEFGVGNPSEGQGCILGGISDADLKDNVYKNGLASRAPVSNESHEKTQSIKSDLRTPVGDAGPEHQSMSVGSKDSDQACSRIKLPPANGSIMKKRASTVWESQPKPSREAATQKRVRFQEPSQPLRTSRKNVRLMHLVRRRQERFSRRSSLKASEDVCVASAKLSGPNKEIDQVLLDDLQYLLDGVFKYDASSKLNCNLVLSSIQALIPLLRKGCHDSGREDLPSIDGVHMRDGFLALDADGYLSDVMEMLISQPKLLRKIVTHFLKLLGNGPMIDAHVALVLIIIFRCAGPMVLVSESEFKALVNAFVQTSLASLTHEANPRHAKKQGEGSQQEGFLNNADDAKDVCAANETLNRLIREAGVVVFDGSTTGVSTFQRSTDAATYLVGTAVAVLLSKVPEVRQWVRETRYLGQIVAALYGAEAIMNKRLKQSGAERRLKLGVSWKVSIGGMFKVLECAALDEICQSRIVSQTKVIAVALRAVRWLRKGKGGGLDSEWVVCNALKACINLTRGRQDGATRFANAEGVKVILDCLVQECIAAGLMGAQKDQKEDDGLTNGNVQTSGAENTEARKSGTCDESFDIRVLCLVLLANVAAGDRKVRETFSEIKAKSVLNMTGGALGVAVEIMKRCSAGKELDVSNDDGFQTSDSGLFDMSREIEGVSDKSGIGAHEADVFRVGKEDTGNEDENLKPSSRGMEKRITIGYSCLLIGVLVWECDKNRAILESILPKNGLQRLAGVLQECLNFHQDVGVNCDSLDGIYAQIIHALSNGASTSSGAEVTADDPVNDCTETNQEVTGVASDSGQVCALDSDALGGTSSTNREPVSETTITEMTDAG